MSLSVHWSLGARSVLLGQWVNSVFVTSQASLSLAPAATGLRRSYKDTDEWTEQFPNWHIPALISSLHHNIYIYYTWYY